MQHHTHVMRTPHMRSVHSNNIQIHPVPVLSQLPTQVSQKLPQNPNSAQQTTQSSMRDHQNRLGKPHLSAEIHNQTTQMQKVHQEHQHINYKNNNNNNTHNNNNNNNSTNYQQYNHINVQQQQDQQPHMGVLQQQQQPSPQSQTGHRNATPMHHMQKPLQKQQPPHAVLQIKNHSQHSLHQIPPSNNSNSKKHKHQQQQQQQQYPTYAYVNSKGRYNNNNCSSNTNSNNSSFTGSSSITATNYSTPKTILQNPNRAALRASTAALPVASAQSTTTSEVVTIVETHEEEESSSSSTTDGISQKQLQQQSDINETHAVVRQMKTVEADFSNEANKENISSDCQTTVSDSNSQLLSNVDSTVTKHSKEKTPMCLVNELARFNKITHQYRLTGEKGPAHLKRFTVTLKLGDEEYTAEGFKIKKAQHLAAAQAIEKTAYKHPIPKANRNNDDGKNRPYIMPTVELNALAMKLGQQTYYLFDPRQMPSAVTSSSSSPSDLVDIMHDGSGIPTHHYGGPRPPLLPPTSAYGHGHGGHIMPPPPQISHSRVMNDPGYGVRRNFDLHGGIYPPPPPPLPPPPHMQHLNQRSYLHRGYPPMHRHHQRYPIIPPPPPPPGLPAARHHMHSHFGIPTTPYKITLIVGKQKFIGVGRTLQQAKHDAAARALQVLKTKSEGKPDDELDDTMDENDAKSPISQVHEAAVKRNMQVHFKILREEGPAHMRNFITACIVGSIVTEGEGHGKKISKKRSAEKMLQELKKLPPLTPEKSPQKRVKVKTPGKNNTSPNAKTGTGTTSAGNTGRRGKRDSSVQIKTKEVEVDEDDDENPVTKLIQIQQNRKEKEPIFEFLNKNGSEKVRRREFMVEVTAQGLVARGTGRNKKLAKRNAAANLLNAIAEAAKKKPIDNATQGENEIISNSTSTPTKISDDVPKENAEQKSINAVDNNTSAVDVPIVSTSAGRVPGILILRQNKKSGAKKKETPISSTPVKTVEIEKTKNEEPIITAPTIVETTTIASIPESNEPTTSSSAPVQQEDVKAETSKSDSTTTTANATVAVNTTAKSDSTDATDAKTTNSSNDTTNSNNSSVTPMMKQKLLYLAKLLGFEVDFSDYPKGNHNEFLTIVTLSTDPPQICHGFGKSTNESQNCAAQNALKILSDLGLNNAKSN